MIAERIKDSETDALPHGWQVSSIGEVADTDPEALGASTAPDFRFHYIALEGVDRGRLTSASEQVYATAPVRARRIIKRGDLLFSTVRPNLQSHLFFEGGPGNWICSTGFCVLRPRVRRVHGEFLFAHLFSDQISRQIEATIAGSNYPAITSRDLRALRFPMPSDTDEQKAIAGALGEVDSLIESLERLIAKKRDIKEAVTQRLLCGQDRLPGFGGEWQITTLLDLADRKKELFDDGDWIESKHITSEGIRLIQTGNIGIGCFVEKDDKKYISESAFTLLKCKQLKKGDLLVCRLADPAGRACVLGDIGEERIVTSVDVTICRPLPAMADRLFLSQLFSTSSWLRAVSDRSGGTTHKRISRGALGRIPIRLPSLAEQTAIAVVLRDIDTELSCVIQRRNKTRDIKLGMMQQLLTGKVRLV